MTEAAGSQNRQNVIYANTQWSAWFYTSLP